MPGQVRASLAADAITGESDGGWSRRQGASTFSNQGPAPTDIGGIQGKTRFYKGNSDSLKRRQERKGTGKNAHMNFPSKTMAKRKGKGKEKSKGQLHTVSKLWKRDAWLGTALRVA